MENVSDQAKRFLFPIADNIVVEVSLDSTTQIDGTVHHNPSSFATNAEQRSPSIAVFLLICGGSAYCFPVICKGLSPDRVVGRDFFDLVVWQCH